MFKNVRTWTKCIHESISEVAWRNQIVHKRNLFEKHNREHCQDPVCCLRIRYDFAKKFLSGFRKAALKKILSEKLLSLLLVYIPASWDPGKTNTGETSLGPNTAGLSWCTMPGVSVYHVSSWSMSNGNKFLIQSVQFCNLVPEFAEC